MTHLDTPPSRLERLATSLGWITVRSPWWWKSQSIKITVSHLDVTKLASVEPPGEDTIGRPEERMESGGCHTKCLVFS